MVLLIAPRCRQRHVEEICSSATNIDKLNAFLLDKLDQGALASEEIRLRKC